MSGPASPTVSVVIPARNRSDLLMRALRSVAAQTVTDLEIIIVDDASDQPLVLQDLDGAPAARLVRNATVLGAQRSRLVGAMLARGTYVALLDSDDWWSPDKIERQLLVLAAKPGAVVSCRVIAARGSLRKPAPWRPLGANEKVEDFLYVSRGMLQTSTLLAKTQTVISLLEGSADSQVHNDTMLFLEAQRRGLPIIQMPEPLSYFDDNPRPDRISYDAGRVLASEAWFRSVSNTWSVEARRGFMLTDMVTRYVNTGQRRKALNCLFRSYHSKISPSLYVKKIAYICFNGSPLRFFQAQG